MGIAYLFIVGEIIVNDDIEMFFENNGGGSYLESIIKSRYIAFKTNQVNLDEIVKLNELIDLELDLAITGAKKAISEVTKDNVRPIK